MGRNKFVPPELLTSPVIAHAVLCEWLGGGSIADIRYLQPEHFHDKRDQAVWRSILALDDQGVRDDMWALIEHLKRNSALDYLDWQGFCTEIMRDGNETDFGSYRIHARTVYENAIRRQLVADHLELINRYADLNFPLPAEYEPLQPQRSWTDTELLAATFPPPGGPVLGLVQNGLTIIAARPKIGKSILAMQLAMATATGGTFLNRPVEQGNVLYYALEDGGVRLQDRLKKLGLQAGTGDILFKTEMTPLNLGGLGKIQPEAREYKLIIVDTLIRMMPDKDTIRDAALFGAFLGRMQRIAIDAGMAFVVVHHARKPNGMARNPVDDTMGRTELTAPADTVLNMYEESRGRCGLSGVSRDFGPVDIAIRHEPNSLAWQAAEEGLEEEQNEGDSELLEELLLLGRATAAELASAIRKDRANTSRRLKKLYERGDCNREVVRKVVYYSPVVKGAAMDAPQGPDYTVTHLHTSPSQEPGEEDKQAA